MAKQTGYLQQQYLNNLQWLTRDKEPRKYKSTYKSLLQQQLDILNLFRINKEKRSLSYRLFAVTKVVYHNAKFSSLYRLSLALDKLLPAFLRTSSLRTFIVNNKQKYHFYNLLYQLSLNSILTNKMISMLEQALSVSRFKQLHKAQEIISFDGLSKEQEIKNVTSSVTLLNKLLARAIYAVSPNYLGSKGYISPYQSKELNHAYKAWVRCLNNDCSLQQKVFLKRFYTGAVKPDDKSYQLAINEEGQRLEKKNTTWGKFLIKSLGTVTIIATSIAQGLVPAVLAASASGGLLTSLAIIGLPSIIMNLFLYNSYVKSFIKDVYYNRLLNDENGNQIPYSRLLFFISVCGGITYGTMAFSTSFEAISAIALLLFPSLVTLSLPGLAVVGLITAFLAGFTFLSLTSLFFSSMIEVVRHGISNQLSDYIRDNFTNYYKQEKSVSKKVLYTLCKLCFSLFLLLSAGYLTILESALLYSMALTLFPLPFVALTLVVIAAPANLLFTFKVYNFIVDACNNLPGLLKNYYINLDNILNNPVVLLKTLKDILLFSGLFILNIIYSKGSAQGLSDEIKMKNCRTILTPFHINPDSASIAFISKVTEVSDAAGATAEGTIETFKSKTTKYKIDRAAFNSFNNNLPDLAISMDKADKLNTLSDLKNVDGKYKSEYVQHLVSKYYKNPITSPASAYESEVVVVCDTSETDFSETSYCNYTRS